MRRIAVTGVVLACALTPGAAANAGGASAPSASGGTLYGAPLANARDKRPTATLFEVAPRSLREGRTPRMALRIDQRGVRTVRARIVFWPLQGRGKVVRIDLGRVRTGRRLRPNWPAGTRLTAGRYTVRLHATGAGGKLLRRAQASGRVPLTVTAPPAPKPKPAPPAAAPAVVVEGGVFPVGGPHTYGDGIGADRGDRKHQGVDILAAEGLPVRAPTAGTITVREYQAGGAGFYLVQAAADGRHFFFAHCKKDTFAVAVGEAVEAGRQLCQVGSTGSSSAPHLHFEIWTGGWRAGKGSTFTDPLPQLLAWDPDY